MDKNSKLVYGMIVLMLVFVTACAQMPKIVELHDPLSPKEHFQLALAYELKTEYDLALREYEEVIRKKMFLGESYTNMANIFFHQGKYDISESYYLKSIHANPLYGRAYNNLAWLYINQNKPLPQAEHLLLQAIEKDPENSPSYLDTLASVYEKEGKWAQSLETLKKVESSGLAGNRMVEIEYLKHLEKILLILDRKSEADQVHKKITTLDGHSPEETFSDVP
ncbi:MAG: tetratricopeptide repeat protein [Nitrospiria bacterium]